MAVVAPTAAVVGASLPVVFGSLFEGLLEPQQIAGVLVALGSSFELAGTYALMLRLFVVVGVIVVFLLAVLIFVSKRLSRRSGGQVRLVEDAGG